MNPPCPPARLAAIEAIRDILTRAEWAHDPDTAIEHLSGVPNAIRVLTTAINGEREVTRYAAGLDPIAATCPNCLGVDFESCAMHVVTIPLSAAEVPIAELVARLGLVPHPRNGDYYDRRGELWAWKDKGGWYADLRNDGEECDWFPSEADALRAYARAKGVA